ncbi:GTP-binding protein [Spirochaetia bacterium]|nr:GTP-binding protein [Spirochaetia bacterium]
MDEDTETKGLLYEDESYRIRACIYEVNRKLGGGFLEAVYQEALEIELEKAKIPYESQKKLHIFYDDKPLKQFYQADFVCFEKIIIEIKAITKLGSESRAQVMNYLAATGLKLGFLVNFCGFPKAEIIRIVR